MGDMAHWMNILWNNSFVNPMQLPLCRNSRAVALTKPGLTADWLAGRLSRLAGWLAGGQNAGKFQIFKIRCRSNFAAFNTVTALLEQYEHI